MEGGGVDGADRNNCLSHREREVTETICVWSYASCDNNRLLFHDSSSRSSRSRSASSRRDSVAAAAADAVADNLPNEIYGGGAARCGRRCLIANSVGAI